MLGKICARVLWGKSMGRRRTRGKSHYNICEYTNKTRIKCDSDESKSVQKFTGIFHIFSGTRVLDWFLPRLLSIASASFDVGIKSTGPSTRCLIKYWKTWPQIHRRNYFNVDQLFCKMTHRTFCKTCISRVLFFVYDESRESVADQVRVNRLGMEIFVIRFFFRNFREI